MTIDGDNDINGTRRGIGSQIRLLFRYAEKILFFKQ